MYSMEGVLMSGVTVFTDADVLCGRGGQAQRHVGNKTYRALVNLNKSLYASCRTTEKIKISRSIVAAIREQKGRFLEKDAGSDTFYDIGDKKAVEKTSQALREGQPKLKKKLATKDVPVVPSNLTAAATRTSLKESAESYQPPPAPHDFEQHGSGAHFNMNDFEHMGLSANQSDVHWEPPPQQQDRPTLPPSGRSDLSVMSEISASFSHLMNEDIVRNSFSIDGSFKEAIQHVADPDNDIFYYGEEDGYAPMEPPPRRMMEARMDSFRHALMNIASPQTSMMSLTSTVGGSSGSAGGAHSAEARANPADIVLPARDMPTAGDDEFHFRASNPDALDDLISVGGLSKLSLMSGMSESTLDTGIVSGRRLVHNGTSELTLDSSIQQQQHQHQPAQQHYQQRVSSNKRNMHMQKGALSTRSVAMSEVSALDFLKEMENEDEA